MAKISKEKWKTYGNVFDEFTHRNLFKLASQGHFEELKSPIMIGKEANVFSAEKKDGSLVAVKIYRLENCDFNRMYEYIRSDTRYMNLKRARRQIIFAWTQREYRNLMKAREGMVRVPLPLTFKDNILVMEFIGGKDAAPQLKDKEPEDLQKFFDSIIENMKLLWKGGLVHGDLSKFNILNLNDEPVLIDFSQGLTIDAYVAKEYLERDVKNVSSYFIKLGLDINEEDVVKKIMK